MRVLIIGANGFLGKALVNYISEKTQHIPISLVRSNAGIRIADENIIEIKDLNTEVNWPKIFSNIDVIIHTAARAHVLRDSSNDPLVEFRKTNVIATINLAKHALAAGVKRFIFISSIGVCGSKTDGTPFSEYSKENPQVDYSISKYEAEIGLKNVFKNTNVELVIIRPLLVYAENAPGNFALLLKLINKRMPFPLALINNKRSFIALENLVVFITVCIHHNKAANELFLIADNESIATKDVIKAIATGMDRSVVMLPIPNFLLHIGALLVKKESTFQQLCGSLEVDNSQAKQVLNWSPVVTTQYSLERTGQKYKNNTLGK